MNPEAVELLRRLLEQQKAQPDKILRAPASETNAPVKSATPKPAKETKPEAAEKKAKVEKPVVKPAPAKKAVEPAPVVVAPPQPTAEQKKISEVEARLDEMMRQKEARDKAAQAAGSKTNAPSGPMTKRQKLDALLKDYIDGKIPEADYHTRRAKLVAEPD